MTAPPELRVKVRLARSGFELDMDERIPLDGITALFGPSGAGKTSLLRVIAGMERAASGEVVFDGTPWQSAAANVPTHRRGIGYVFQDGRLFPHLTVEQNLRFAERRVPPAREMRIELGATIEALSLQPLLARMPGSLSGGEQQRAAIGRALMTSPRLLLMDEPLSSLDTGRKREILPLIERLPGSFGVPVLYVTHNVDEVARLATHIVLMSAGRAVARGRVADILERTDLWRLAGAETSAVLDVKILEPGTGVMVLALGAQCLRVPASSALPPGAALRVRVLARDVALATEKPRGISIRNVLAARVLGIETDTSAHAELLLEVEGQHLRSRITREALDELGIEVGTPVFALVKSVVLESALLS